MYITEMNKSDFRKVRVRGWNEDIGEFDSLVIIPGNSRELHDSGFRLMTYCLCRGLEPVCLTSGCSDVIHLDGIGGYGKGWSKRYGRVPNLIPPSGWNMDSLPKTGYLRLWATDKKLVCNSDLSSFEVYAIDNRNHDEA